MKISPEQIELLIQDLYKHQKGLVDRFNSLSKESQEVVEELVFDHIDEVEELKFHLQVTYLDPNDDSYISEEDDDIIFDDDSEFETSS